MTSSFDSGDWAFGSIGIITGTIFYITPLFVIYNLNKGRINVDKTSGMGMFFSLISSLLWMMPIILEKSPQNGIHSYLFFFICNCLGCLLNFCWTILYLYYFTKNNSFRYFIYIIAVVDVIAEIAFIESDQMNNFKDKATLIKIYKYIAASFNIMMYFSPGLNIIKIFKQKNRELISITASLIGALNCGAWLGFGIIKENDLPIVVANGAGLGLCIIQIIIYFSLGAPKEENKVDIEKNNEIDVKPPTHKEHDDFFKGFI